MSRSVGGALVPANQVVHQAPGGMIDSTTVYPVAVALTVQPGLAVLTKATAGAYTIPAPSNPGDNGMQMTIVSATAAAHTVTGVALLADGATGAPHSTATYNAYKGAALRIEAYGGLWNVIGTSNVTVA